MTHWSNETRTAIKTHTCAWCSRTIQPGEKYRRGAGMDGSTAWTWKNCLHCQALFSFMDSIYAEEEYSPDALGEFARYEMRGSLPQLRVAVQFLRRWARADGTLYPVPVPVVMERTTPYSTYSVVSDIKPGEEA